LIIAIFFQELFQGRAVRAGRLELQFKSDRGEQFGEF
jgi:hypothetical protein